MSTPDGTIALREASRCTWDAIISGAGPAGAVAARELACRGWSVLLVDRAAFPRDKVCGCCVSAAALHRFDSLGLGELVRGLGGLRFDTFRLAAEGRIAECPIPAGLAVSRRDLDSALVCAAIEAGAAFLPATRIESTTDAGDVRTLIARNGADRCSLSARLVIAADGVGSTLVRSEPAMRDTVSPRSRIGVGTTIEHHGPFPADAIQMACGRDGYVGVVRVSGTRLNVAAAFTPEAVRASGGPGELAWRTLLDAGLEPLDALRTARWSGTPRLTRTLGRVACRRMIAVGDAAGYVEPFTGEGIAWAADSAAVAASIAAEYTHDPATLASTWRAWHARTIRPRHRRCTLVAAALRSGAIRALGVRSCVGLPALSRWIARHVCTHRGAPA